jgi:ssDNA-specific exonuclease RecJ
MKCDSAYRNYWFCHKSIDDSYISRQEDKHREEYAKGYKFLRVFQATDVDVRIEALTNELKAKDQRILELEKKLSNELDHLKATVISNFETLKTLKERMDNIKKSKEQKQT